MDRIGKLQCPKSVFRICSQGRSVQQVSRKCVQYANMLWVITVCLDFFFFRVALVPGIITVEAGFSFILSQSEASDLSVFTDQFAPFAVNLQPVGSRQISCGCGKYACCAITEFRYGVSSSSTST